MGFVVGDKTIFVARKNHSIEHNRVISNYSRTPLSYEDVVQHTPFAVQQQYNSLGGRGEVDFHCQKKNFRPPAAVWWSLFRRFRDMLVFLLQWRVF